jgi:hypothetical protein
MITDEHLGPMLTLVFGALVFTFPRVFKCLVGLYLLILFGLGFVR